MFSQSDIRNINELAEELLFVVDQKEGLEENLFIAAYEKWGLSLGLHLYGRFSIVLENGDCIILIRDHFGLEPLYYAEYGDKLYYSSSLRCLLSESKMPKHLNQDALLAYFLYGYPAGSETFICSVHKVLPGHALVWNHKEHRFIDDVEWFSQKYEKDTSISERSWIAILKTITDNILCEEKKDITLRNAVCLLSSGVDSSYLFAASTISKAISIGYPEKQCSEAEDAKCTAELLDKEFSAIEVSEEDFLTSFYEVMDSIDQPIVNPSIPVIYSALKTAAKTSKLFYSGEGVDEFFAGYFSPFDSCELRFSQEHPYHGFGQFVSEDIVARLLKVELKEPLSVYHKRMEDDTKDLDVLSSFQQIDVSLFLEGDTCAYISYLRRKLEIEIRQPFADPRLFEVASNIPSELLRRKINANGTHYWVNKYIFRALAMGKLPVKIAFRQKKPFITPVRLWMEKPAIKEHFRQFIFSKNAAIFFRQDYLEDIWNRFISGENQLWKIIYAVGAFLSWYESLF